MKKWKFCMLNREMTMPDFCANNTNICSNTFHSYTNFLSAECVYEKFRIFSTQEYHSFFSIHLNTADSRGVLNKKREFCGNLNRVSCESWEIGLCENDICGGDQLMAHWLRWRGITDQRSISNPSPLLIGISNDKYIKDSCTQFSFWSIIVYRPYISLCFIVQVCGCHMNTLSPTMLYFLHYLSLKQQVANWKSMGDFNFQYNPRERLSNISIHY